MNSEISNLQYMFERHGSPSAGSRLDEGNLKAYDGRLPSVLIDHWREHGLGIWLKGYFQFCDPEKYEGVLRIVLDGDPDLEPEQSYVIGYWSMGRLLVWNEKYRRTMIDLVDHRVECPELTGDRKDRSDARMLRSALSFIDLGVHDPGDDEGNKLFPQLLRKYGPPKFSEIYAPKLHPALGGSMSVENFRPVDAEVAMTLMAQAAGFDLHRVTTTPTSLIDEVVRPIGG